MPDNPKAPRPGDFMDAPGAQLDVEAMQAKLKEVKEKMKDPNNCRTCHKAFDNDERTPVEISCGCKSICLSCEQRLTELGWSPELLRLSYCTRSSSCTTGKTVVDVR